MRRVQGAELTDQISEPRVHQSRNTHTSRALPARVVYGYLGDHDLLRVRTDPEKFLLLAALNLVECVAEVGSTTSS